MPWDLESIATQCPPNKVDHYQSLLIRANMLGPLPTTEKKAIVVDSNDLEVVLFKAFEETFDNLDVPYFETRVKRLKATVGEAQSFRMYFPGVNLHISNADSNLYIAHFRVALRNVVGYNLPAA
jgi:hypothetical protein